MTQIAAVQRAVKLVGSQRRLAKKAGLSQQFVSKLLLGKCGLSGKTALAIERATAGRVARWELCPDLWPAASCQSHADSSGEGFS